MVSLSNFYPSFICETSPMFRLRKLFIGLYLVLQIGKTKVFLRAGQMAELDARRTEVLGRSASIIQRKVRSYMARRSFTVLRRSTIQIQSLCRGNEFAAYLGSYFRMHFRNHDTHLIVSVWSLQGNLLDVYMRACGGKQLLLESRQMCACILLGRLTKSCGPLLFQFRQECVGWLRAMSFDSEARQKQQLLFRYVFDV